MRSAPLPHHPPAHATRLVVLGRDGVLNRVREDHVKSPDEWEPVPGALEAVARLNHAGWHVVVATNQGGIGRGLLDMASVNAIHAAMHKRLAAMGGRIDAVFFCPHAPEDGCECRKPQPGLLLDIAERYGVELADVPMVTDNVRDLEAAASAGCPPHLVRSGRAAAATPEAIAAIRRQVPSAQVHDSLGAFVDRLLLRTPPPAAAAPGAGVSSS